MDDWAEIRHLFSTGKHSKREIGRIVGVSRGTVDRAPKYHRAAGVSSFDAFTPRVRELLVKTPTMPAATLAERVGWSGSASLFRSKVAAIRPEYAPPDPADRLVHEPGFQVQCDLWFPHEQLPVGAGQHDTPPVSVMASAFSDFSAKARASCSLHQYDRCKPLPTARLRHRRTASPGIPAP